MVAPDVLRHRPGPYYLFSNAICAICLKGTRKTPRRVPECVGKGDHKIARNVSNENPNNYNIAKNARKVPEHIFWGYAENVTKKHMPEMCLNGARNGGHERNPNGSRKGALRLA